MLHIFQPSIGHRAFIFLRMSRPSSPYYGSHNGDHMSTNTSYDHAGVKPLKRAANKSFKRKLKAAVRKIALVFRAFGGKSGNEVAKDEAYGSGVGRSSQFNTNSSGFSSGSKFKGTSPYRQPRSYDSSNPKNGQVYGSLNFSLEDILKATKNFSKENVIGGGGFGTVYKAQLKDGTLIAVKRARKNLVDKRTVQEFRSEILAFSKIEHLNLVKFYGYLEHPDENLIVMEYVANGTLFHLLHGNQGFGIELGERLDIATDVAHAITYLHSYTDPPIIHRDIKASNVLITERLRAKVADFGLARLVSDGQDKTHVSTQIKGTIGYLDPEYMKTYQLTEKSDVYSFGVLLVELVTGRHPVELNRATKEKITTIWALNKLRDGLPVLAMDPRLQRSPASIEAVKKILELARECTSAVRQSRPSMKDCVEALWVIRKAFKEAADSGHLVSNKSEDLLEVGARKNRQRALGIQGDPYSFMSA